MTVRHNISYDEEKLTELVLYVGAKCALDQHYGVLKLNKVLFYSDFRAYRSLGEPITGASYKKYTHGPAPSVMKRLREKLIQIEDAIEYINPLPFLNDDGEPLKESRLLPKRKPVLEKFSTAQMAIVDSVIEWLRPMTGAAVSRMSHLHPGWAFSEMEEFIPYSSELLSEGPMPLSKKDLARATEICSQYRRGEIHPATALAPSP